MTKTLKALYPDYQARGYKAGDVRGAFVIRSWLDKGTTDIQEP